MVLYVSRKVSDPLEIPANSQIQRKSLIYKGFEFVGFFTLDKFQQNLYIRTVS